MTREELANKALDALEKVLKSKQQAEEATAEIEAICKAIAATGADDKVEEFIQLWSGLAKQLREAVKQVKI